jgi:hypothetical protein
LVRVEEVEKEVKALKQGVATVAQVDAVRSDLLKTLVRSFV